MQSHYLISFMHSCKHLMHDVSHSLFQGPIILFLEFFWSSKDCMDFKEKPNFLLLHIIIKA